MVELPRAPTFPGVMLTASITPRLSFFSQLLEWKCVGPLTAKNIFQLVNDNVSVAGARLQKAGRPNVLKIGLLARLLAAGSHATCFCRNLAGVAFVRSRLAFRR